MSKPSITSITCETESPSSDTTNATGYRIIASDDGFESVHRIQDVPDPNSSGERITALSGPTAVPEEVQAAVDPLVHQLGLSIPGQIGNVSPADFKRVEIKIETVSRGAFFIERRENGSHYTKQDGTPVTPPQDVINTAQSIFPNFNP